MNKDDVIDISKIIAADTAVWPGDTTFQLSTQMSIENGQMVNLTTLTLSAHTASHADAPFHVINDAARIDQVNLQVYWGLAQVITVVVKDRAMVPTDFIGCDLSLAPRLLVRTPAEQVPYNKFPESYPFPDPTLAEYLAESGVILYGTDAPSVDSLHSQTLLGHQALINHGIAILEGLDLADAKDGLYELSALPLKIRGGDGSPVRAALRPLPNNKDLSYRKTPAVQNEQDT